jgi:hypothetical protein
MARIGWQPTPAVEEIIQTGRSRRLYPARPRLITNFATAWGENSAETTVGKLWSRETSVVLDTSERLGAPANLIAESTLPSADPARAPKFRYTRRRMCRDCGSRFLQPHLTQQAQGQRQNGRGELGGPLATSRGRASHGLDDLVGPRFPCGISQLTEIYAFGSFG